MRLKASCIDVSPESPCPLAGYSSRKSNWQVVADPLELNAVRFCGTNQDVVLVTIDSLSFSQELEDHCRNSIPSGCTATVVGIASHTHFAPALDPHLPKLGSVDPAYRALVFDRAEELMRSLYASDPSPASISMGTAHTDHTINRRRRAWTIRRGFPPLRKACEMLPNVHGSKDEKIHVATLFCDGQPAAFLWSFACHPVTFHNPNAVSAEYPGAVRRQIRSLAGGLPCLFLPGFLGNIRPNIIASGNSLRHLLRSALQGQYFGKMDEITWERWSRSLADIACATLPAKAGMIDIADVEISERLIPYDVIQSQDVPDRPQPIFARIKLGEALELRVVSGEPILELRNVLERVLPKPAGKCLYIGYRGHLFGYLPTSEILAEGGYEANGFRAAFDLPGTYFPDVDARLKELFS